MVCSLHFVSASGTNQELPFEGVHVAVRIVNLVAEVQIVQFFVNNNSTKIDCTYEFPMDDAAAVCGFEVELNDRLLLGEVREKQEARAEYNSAIANGQTAGLVEENKPDMFIQRIGNIPAYSRVNVRITYVTELKVDPETGGAIFVLPTSISPRYTPYSNSGPLIPFCRRWQDVCLGRRCIYSNDLAHWNNQVETLPFYKWSHNVPEFIVNREHPGAFSITIEAEMASRILSMESRTHRLQIDETDKVNRGACSLWSVTEPMGKDFEVIVYQEKPHEPSVQLEVAPDGSGCAMLSLIPEFDAEPQPVEIVFLVDCSGSMAGSRIAAAVRALSLFIQSLPMSCTFNIYRFGSSHLSLFPRSQPYTAETLQSAKKFVAATTANLGGTEILRPLDAILSSSGLAGSNRLMQVFVLTDGQVSNTENVIDLCRRSASFARVFSVGIGDEVSRHLVQGMARAASGTAEFIVGTELAQSSSSLEIKLINQLKLATLPSINKITVDWLGGATTVAPSPTAELPEQSPPASKFFSTGPPRPGQMRPAGSTVPSGGLNPNAVGSGTWVGAVPDASDAQPLGRNESLYQAPFLPPPLYSGSKFLMFCFFRPGELTGVSSVNVSAVEPGGDLFISVPVTKVASMGKSIHVLAARALIRDLNEGTSHLHYRRKWTSEVRSNVYTSFGMWSTPVNTSRSGKQSTASAFELEPIGPNSHVVKQEMVDVGCKFGIVSRETSLVAVERWRDGSSSICASIRQYPPGPSQEHLESELLRSISSSVVYCKIQAPSRQSRISGALDSFPLSLSAPRFSSRPSFSFPNIFSYFSSGSNQAATATSAQAPTTVADATLLGGLGSSDVMSRLRSARATPSSPAAHQSSSSNQKLTQSFTFREILNFQDFDGRITESFECYKALGTSDIELRNSKVAQRLAVEFSIQPGERLTLVLAIKFLQVLEARYPESEAVWNVAAKKTEYFVIQALIQASKKSKAEVMLSLRTLIDAA